METAPDRHLDTVTRFFAVVLTIIMLAAACGEGEDLAADPLATTSWEMTHYRDGPNLVAASPTDMVTAVFADGTVSGSDGCNSYVMTYSVNGGALSFGDLAVTGAFCDPDEVVPQGDAFLAATRAATRFVLGSDLELLGADGATLVRFRPASDLPLAGIAWWLTGYAGEDAGLVSPIVDSRISLTFRSDGTLEGVAGCNAYSADYETNGSDLALGGFAHTDMACPDPEGVMQQETAYLVVLTRARGFATTLTGLDLLDAAGDVIAQYRFGGRVR